MVGPKDLLLVWMPLNHPPPYFAVDNDICKAEVQVEAAENEFATKVSKETYHGPVVWGQILEVVSLQDDCYLLVC